jgi:hypothetical protein
MCRILKPEVATALMKLFSTLLLNILNVVSFSVYLIFLLLLLNCNGHPWHERSQLMRDRKLAATPPSPLSLPSYSTAQCPPIPLYCLYISFMTFSFFQFVRILYIIIVFVYCFLLLFTILIQENDMS